MSRLSSICNRETLGQVAPRVLRERGHPGPSAAKVSCRGVGQSLLTEASGLVFPLVRLFFQSGDPNVRHHPASHSRFPAGKWALDL